MHDARSKMESAISDLVLCDPDLAPDDHCAEIEHCTEIGAASLDGTASWLASLLTAYEASVAPSLQMATTQRRLKQITFEAIVTAIE